jgi:hypothetical protein
MDETARYLRGPELELLQLLLVDIMPTLAHPVAPPQAKNAAIAAMIDERAPWLIHDSANLSGP